jgi:NAD(P)-dependent dehydrogenase (short-subunit alcohol dehydrogenase family)
MKDVRGKTALVTGGAMGMGLLWCERFADDGANLVIWDLDADRLETAADGLRRRGVEVMTQVVDVSDPRLVADSAEAVQRQTGGVDVLVNNAGIVHAGPFLDTPDGKLSAVIDVDLKGPMWTMKAFLPHMVERNCGHVINISSASGYVGVPRMPSYVAAKWGAIGLTESVRLELELMNVTGVKFTLVCPSFVDTGMFAGAKPPLLTKMLAPREIVDIAYAAFKADRYVVNEPWIVKITPALKALLPTKAFDLISGLLGASSSMVQWRDERSTNRPRAARSPA